MSDEARASFSSSSKLGGRAFTPTWAWLSHAAPPFAGAVSGVAVVLVGQPFDTIKVRQQVLQQRTLVVLGQCLRREGLAGLYKGTSPQIPGSAVQHAVRMGSYGIARDALLQRNMEPGALVGGIAGIFTGCCVSVIATPVERLKCLQQVETTRRLPLLQVL